MEVDACEEVALPYWLSARLRLRERSPREALRDLERALAQDPDNPELHLVRAEALAALGDAAALTAFRLAVLKAEMPADPPAAQPLGGLAPRAPTPASPPTPSRAGSA